MSKNERFTWKTVHGWQTSAFLKVMNGLDKKNQQLKEDNKQLKQELESFEQVYQSLKHRHSLLHDECLEAECDRDSLKKDVISLEEENYQLKREKERYKRLSEIRYENIKNRILSIKEFINDCEDEKVKNALEDLFYSEVKEHDLAKENRELREEKEFWKGDACNCSNYLSILSMDCQIVQEAICDLKKATDELDDKFDELNQHRIKMYSR